MKTRLLVSPLIVAGLIAAGCGSSGSSSGSTGSGADPAKLVPSTAPVYVEATLRPDGQLGDDAKAALSKLLRTNDPGAKITGLLDKALAKDKASWENDIKPWLGERVGFFITSFGSGKVVGALVADTTDSGKAQDAIKKALSHPDAKNPNPKVTTQSYKGVSVMEVAQGDHAAAVVDGYVVGGTLKGVQQAIDTAKGGRPLTDVADFVSARAAVSADKSLGMAYVQPQAIVDALSSLSSLSPTGGSAQSKVGLSLLRQLVAKAGRAAAASLQADSSSVRVNAALLGTPAAPATGTTGADTLAALPGDAWLGIGFKDLGGSLKNAIAQISQLSALTPSGSSVTQAIQRFQAQTHINLQRDLFSWMGDGALYARGHSLLDLGFALTLHSKNPARSQRAVALIGRAIAASGGKVQKTNVDGYTTAIAMKLGNLPVPLVIAAGGDRFSIGLNPQALTDVLHPSSTLGDSPQYAAATKALGSGLRPVFLLDTPTVVNLLETFGVGANPAFAKVKPYLDVIGPIAAGVEHDGDTTKASLAVGLK